jgi:hypothetical protein
MEGGEMEVMQAAIAMHRACVKDAKNGGVLKAARMSGYLAFGLNEEGQLVPATQQRSGRRNSN